MKYTRSLIDMQCTCFCDESKSKLLECGDLEGHPKARQTAQKIDGMMLGGITSSALATSPIDYTTNDDDNDMPMQEIVPTTLLLHPSCNWETE